MKFQLNSPEIDKKVKRLISKMSTRDKVMQMVYVDGNVPENTKIISEGNVGCVANIFGAQEVNKVQRYTQENGKHKIPYLIINDVIQGYKTIFPIPLAEACSFDADLVERSAETQAKETQAVGSNWIAGPMVDVARDPRWGRIAEGSGEDTYLNCIMGAARVKGYKKVDRIVSCTKHFAAYGTCEGGRDYNTSNISENTLRNVYLPPFKACVEAGTESIMIAFNDVLGLPMTANKYLLTDVLRGEFGFDGHLATDYNAIAELITHGVAEDKIDACKIAVNAGAELDMASGIFIEHLMDLVDSGEILSEIIDKAVYRILYIKFYMGLFDNMYYDEKTEQETVLSDEFKNIALESARKSIVLLKNDNSVLPLKKSGLKVLVTGPLADDNDAPLGWWRCKGDTADVTTVLDAIKNTVTDKNSVIYTKGCDLIGGDSCEIDKALKAAESCDVIIAVLGEHAKMSGESHCRSDISLPGLQSKLLNELHKTGKPIITVLINGRPLVLSDEINLTNALIEAWQFGISGQAVADILFGDCNPSAKTCVSFPRNIGQIPIYYSVKNTGRPYTGADVIPNFDDGELASFQTTYNSKYLDVQNSPLIPFGFGLSYTTFDYGEVTLSKQIIIMGQSLKAYITIKNTGSVSGEEIAQLYIGDVKASVTRPIKELKGFTRIHLEPGESKQVEFTITPEDLEFYNFENKLVLEPGLFKVWISPDSVRGEYKTFELKEQQL